MGLFRKSVKVNVEKGTATRIKNVGKSYAISDIHGMYGSYMEAINRLENNDKLYVIGDVIDRGKNGIKILSDMMTRDNVKFILGNHEWQMLETLMIIKNSKISLNDEKIDLFTKAGKFFNSEIEAIEEAEQAKTIGEMEKYQLKKEEMEKYRKKKEEILEQIGVSKLSKKEKNTICLWLGVNHGSETLKAYFKLPTQQQEAIYRYLTKSNIIDIITVKNEKKCLVHAAPPYSQRIIDKVNGFDKDVGYSFLNILDDEKMREQMMRVCTETRENNEIFGLWQDNGYKVIYGHTPNFRTIKRDKETNAVCIDAACSMNGKLALYCIDDDTVEYIEPREGDIGVNR